MIPVTLNLKNFMSYKSLELDFSEIHVACLSGENGAGKSSILDAITWCLWQESRTKFADELIRIGESEMSVDLIFSIEDQLYRIIRTVKKSGKIKKSSQASLEMQVMSDKGYKSITGKTSSETQARIIETVKMDFNTFINSAFILQGKADQFTTKSPTDRKKVLAEILNLSQYDVLQEKAKAKLKDIEIEKAQKEDFIKRNNDSLVDEELVREKLKISETSLFNLEDELKKLKELVDTLIAKKELCSNELSVLNQIKKSHQSNTQQVEEINTAIVTNQSTLQNVQKVLDKREEIEQRYEHLKTLKVKQEELSNKLMKSAELEKEINKVKTEINRKKHKLEIEVQKLEERFNQYQKEKSEYEKVIKDKAKILENYEKLLALRAEETEYQKKFNQVQNLTEKKHKLEKKLQEELQTIKISENRLKVKISERTKQIEAISELKKANEELHLKIEELNKKAVYKEEITRKGSQLNADINNNKKHLEDKKREIANFENKVKQWTDFHEANCPMCERHLDDQDRKKIIEKYQQDIESLEQEIEKLNLENVNFEKQKQECAEEFKKTSAELKEKDALQKQLGEIEQKLSSAKEAETEVVNLSNELKLIEAKLEKNLIDESLQNEITAIEQQLVEINYNAETLSILQSKVNGLKWAELKNSQLEQAENKNNEILKLLPELESTLTNLKQQLENNTFAVEDDFTLTSLLSELETVSYKKEEHEEVNKQIEALKNYETHWNNLQRADAKKEELKNELNNLNKTKEALEIEIATNTKEIEKIPNLEKTLFELSKEIDEKNAQQLRYRQEENILRAEVVRSTEKLEQFEKMKVEILTSKSLLDKLEYEILLYKELVNAFGKKGIQAVIIENVIPEIENYANRLLNKMTEGRMNIAFTTRKALRSSDEIRETLDIYISDELGTRNYEMYSGGEAFRVNFAIRLALSKILARRAGTKLRTLVIDEGFGTQDSKGISRLVQAINTVSSDFDKIIIVTHIAELKEAFPSKIEVFKTIHGSEVRLFT